MIEFRASHIESFRKYLNDDISKQMMLDSLQGKTTASVKMQIGTMYHELIQSKGKTSDLFNMNQVQEAQNKFARGVYEIKAKKDIITEHGVVSISGIADNIVGNVVNEFKTCYGTFSIDRYLESMQWKIYTWLFDVPVVKYTVYEFPAISTSITSIDDVKKPLEYRHEHTFSCYANEFDIREIYTMASALSNFCKVFNIQPITSVKDVYEI